MFESQPLIYWVALAAYASPAIPLSIGCVRAIKLRNTDHQRVFAPLICVCLSLVWLLLAVPFGDLLGPTYSHMRYGIISLNFFTNLIAAGCALTARPTIQIATTIAALMLTAVWGFIGAINSVV